MAGYIGSKASVVSSGAERKKTFAITTTTTVLTGLSYTPTFVHLFHNGVRLVDGTDYTATNGTSITLTSAAESGDEVVVISYATFQVADAYTKAEADAEFVSDPNGAVTVDGSGNVGVTEGAKVYFGGGTDSSSHYIKYNSGNNGLELHSYGSTIFTNTLSGTERMRIDASGRVTMPYQPAFDVGPNAAAAVGDNIIFDVANFNNGNHFNTSNGRFTAPVQGMYSFSFGTIKSPPSNVETSVLRFELSKNGAGGSYAREFRLAEGSIYGDNGCITWIVLMNAGDYVNIRVKSNSHGGNFPSPQYTTFNGYLIG